MGCLVCSHLGDTPSNPGRPNLSFLIVGGNSTPRQAHQQGTLTASSPRYPRDQPVILHNTSRHPLGTTRNNKIQYGASDFYSTCGKCAWYNRHGFLVRPAPSSDISKLPHQVDRRSTACHDVPVVGQRGAIRGLCNRSKLQHPHPDPATVFLSFLPCQLGSMHVLLEQMEGKERLPDLYGHPCARRRSSRTSRLAPSQGLLRKESGMALDIDRRTSFHPSYLGIYSHTFRVDQAKRKGGWH